MTKAIVIRKFGGPKVLKLEDVEVGDPGSGEIRVRHEAIGLNFIDVYHRTGLYPNELPFTPGSEAAGVVTAVGKGVSDFKEGDRIAYFNPIGSYAEERLMPASKAVPIPDDIEADVAAAIILKGMTVNYLLTMTWVLQAHDTALIHAAAGGVGLIAVTRISLPSSRPSSDLMKSAEIFALSWP